MLTDWMAQHTWTTSFAQCAAYLVLAHFGIDTGSCSFGYVAIWAQDMAILKRNISTAREPVDAIITSLSVPAAVPAP